VRIPHPPLTRRSTEDRNRTSGVLRRRREQLLGVDRLPRLADALSDLREHWRCVVEGPTLRTVLTEQSCVHHAAQVDGRDLIRNLFLPLAAQHRTVAGVTNSQAHSSVVERG